MKKSRIDVPLGQVYGLKPETAHNWCYVISIATLMAAHGLAVPLTQVITDISYDPNEGWDDSQAFRCLKKHGFRYRTGFVPPDFSAWQNLRYPIVVYFWLDFGLRGQAPEGHAAVMFGVDQAERAILLDSSISGFRLLPTRILLEKMYHRRIPKSERGTYVRITGRRTTKED